MPSGSVIAKVKKRVIDTGRIFDICVQGAHRSDKIIFVIPEETLYPVRDGVETEVPLHECYFYLLYKRNGDSTTQIPKYLSEKSYDETTHMISVEFVPDATFTANEGSVQIQLFACDTQEDFTDTTVDIDEIPVWTTVNTSIMISKSQFKDKQVIVDENMFVKGIAEMSAYLLSAEGAASDAEEFAKGQRSDGKTVPQVSDSANDNAKWYKEQTQGYYNKVVSLETDIVALYNDKSNLDAVAGDLENIDIVATNIGDVNDVADDITKVAAVADDLEKIDDVYADLDNIDSVQAKLTEIETVAGDISNVNTVANDKTNIDAVAGNKTNIDTVAGISSNVTTVAGISANVTTVAGISSSVTTVAGDKTNIDAVAGNKSNIDTVAGVSSSVNTVAGISSAVSAVAAVDDEVETVAGISSDVSAVAAVATDVASVADELTDIGTVADAISDVSAVAGIATDVSSVSAVASDVSAVADELTDIGTVASSISDVSAVADDISAVSAVADDLTNIDAVAADLPNINLKENVANKVTSISGSSTDTQYPSAKCVYTETSALKGAIAKNTAEIQNLKQKAGDDVTYNYPNDTQTGHSAYMPNLVPPSMAKNALVETIVGKSRAWNQLTKNGDFSNGTTNWFSPQSITASSNVLTMTFDSSDSHLWVAQDGFNPIQGHTYLLCAEVCSSRANNEFRFILGGSDVFTDINCPANTWVKQYAIYTISSTPSNDRFLPFYFSNAVMQFNDTVQVKKVILRDLTLIFPEGVPSTVAECVQKCPDILKYDAYGYSIVDTVVEGVESIGKNLAESISQAAGSTPYAVVLFANAELEPSTTYTISFVGANGNKLYSNENLFASIVTITCNGTRQSMTVTTKANISKGNSSQFYDGKWMLFKNQSDNTVNASFSDVQIEKGPTATAYSPYFTDTLSLPTSVTLRSAGTGYEDILDVETGGITRKCVEYTITGDESFTFYTSADASLGNHYGVVFPIPSAMSGIRTVLDAVGLNDIGLTLQYANNDKTMYISPSNIIMINDAWTTEATFVTNITGKHLCFALQSFDTSESIAPTIDNSIATEGGGTINTVQTQTPVIDNSLDVGFLAL